jgi:AcrR family transcriptional regulator
VITVPNSHPSAPPRRYRGVSADERRAQRRRQLIEAAVSVYGERGYRSSSVKAVCDAAGLTERYFYESFLSSEELLVATFEGVTSLLLNELRAAGKDTPLGAARVRGVLDAYYSALRLEPVAARLFLTELVGVSPSTDQIVRNWRSSVADLLEAAWGAEPSASDSLLKAAVMGGVVSIAVIWVLNGYSNSLPEVVETAFRVCSLLKER